MHTLQELSDHFCVLNPAKHEKKLITDKYYNNNVHKNYRFAIYMYRFGSVHSRSDVLSR